MEFLRFTENFQKKDKNSKLFLEVRVEDWIEMIESQQQIKLLHVCSSIILFDDDGWRETSWSPQQADKTLFKKKKKLINFGMAINAHHVQQLGV